jgi:hypothetical protein
MDLRGEEGESCIAAEESKCNRLTRYRRKGLRLGLDDGEWTSWEGRKRGRRREKKERKRLL